MKVLFVNEFYEKPLVELEHAGKEIHYPAIGEQLSISGIGGRMLTKVTQVVTDIEAGKLYEDRTVTVHLEIV